MAKMTVDFSKITGPVKAMHAVGQPQEITTDLVGYDVSLIDQDHFMTKVDWNPTSFVLGENDVVYLEKAE